MMEWTGIHPGVEVREDEYQRLLGYPPGHALDGRSLELREWALGWYARHGHPWVYAREAGSVAANGRSVNIEGERFQSVALRRRFERAAADCAVLAAVSAGAEIELEAQRLWREERPDEYYFLEVLGSAVVERLTEMAGERLCEWAEGRGMAVLPHDSPGYAGWDVAEQARLLGLLQGAGSLPGKLEALESGALRPKKSLLAVFGLTRRTDGVRPLTELAGCESCAMARCQYRRTTERP
jgi:hypothetical protein